MLKGIDPLLTPDLLYALGTLGHGEEVVLADRNYPPTKDHLVVRLPGTDLAEVAAAILTVFPIDDFIAEPIAAMLDVGNPGVIPDVQREVFNVINETEGRVVVHRSLDRHAFYERAVAARLVILTGETRSYGCLILTKGVVK